MKLKNLPGGGSQLTKPLEEVSLERAKSKTHVAFVLDRSGSMELIEQATVKAYNTQLQTIRNKSEHDVRSYLTRFDDQIEVLLENEPVLALTELRRLYPRGATALFDAVGDTIDKVESHRKGDEAALVVVISDGEENCSRTWSQQQLKRNILRLTETGLWTFVFIGPEHVAQQMAGLGFKTENIQSVSQQLLPEAFEKSSANLGRYLEARNVGGLLPAYFGGDS